MACGQHCPVIRIPLLDIVVGRLSPCRIRASPLNMPVTEDEVASLGVIDGGVIHRDWRMRTVGAQAEIDAAVSSDASVGTLGAFVN